MTSSIAIPYPIIIIIFSLFLFIKGKIKCFGVGKKVCLRGFVFRTARRLKARRMGSNFLPHPLFAKTGALFPLREPDNDPALILYQLAFAVFLRAPTQLSHGDQRFDSAFQQCGAMA